MAGKYFEELEVGCAFEHQPGRTVTETDNLLFTALTLNPQPLHLDAELAKNTQHGQILVDSLFTLALVVGVSVGDTTLGTTIGNLGFDKTMFPKPVFIVAQAAQDPTGGSSPSSMSGRISAARSSAPAVGVR